MSTSIGGSNLTFSDGTTQTYAGTVLSVTSAQISNVVSVSPTSSWQNISGLSVTVTPKSSSSRFLLMFSGCISDSSYSSNSAYLKDFRFARNGTGIGLGNLRSAELQGSTGAGSVWAANYTRPVSKQYVDSPATGSAVTYTVQWYPSYVTPLIGGSYNSGAAYNSSNVTSLVVIEFAS